MSRLKNLSTTFKEGRYFDLWLIPHALTGVIGAFSNVFFGLSTFVIFVVGAALMIVWEVIEVVMGIRETWENRVVDVVVGLVGVALALAVAPWLSQGGQVVAFAVSLVVGAVAGVIGWRASVRKRRAKRKATPAGG